LHLSARVTQQTVPDQGDLVTGELATQLTDECDQTRVVVGTRSSAEHHPGCRAVGGIGEHRGHRHPLPVKRRAKNRRLSSRGPGPSHRRGQRDAGFVLEDQPRASAMGVFFTLGQRVATHSSIASSLRSAARRAGRWGLQPSWPMIRHTWPG